MKTLKYTLYVYDFPFMILSILLFPRSINKIDKLFTGAKKKYTGIHGAVEVGDVLELEAMVKNGASINEVEEKDKFTPLHTAANSGALEVVYFVS